MLSYNRDALGRVIRAEFDFEEALYARFQKLESRLDRPDCIALCRANAEEHARLLGLPPIGGSGSEAAIRGHISMS